MPRWDDVTTGHTSMFWHILDSNSTDRPRAPPYLAPPVQNSSNDQWLPRWDNYYPACSFPHLQSAVPFRPVRSSLGPVPSGRAGPPRGNGQRLIREAAGSGIARSNRSHTIGQLQENAVNEETSEYPQTVVITGGNSGLGYECAKTLLSASDATWHVILACRDANRAQGAVDQLTADVAAAGRVEAMSLDLASLASIRAFAADLTNMLSVKVIPPLHAIVCNAGVNPGPTLSTTADGFESTFGVNHLGHFLLVNELLPTLQPPGRVVVVASGVHDPAQKAGVPLPA